VRGFGFRISDFSGIHGRTTVFSHPTFNRTLCRREKKFVFEFRLVPGQHPRSLCGLEQAEAPELS
jgi:hypothetical protein